MLFLLTALDIEVKAKDRRSVTREANLADWKSMNLTSVGAPEASPSSSYLNKILDHQRSPWHITPNYEIFIIRGIWLLSLQNLFDVMPQKVYVTVNLIGGGCQPVIEPMRRLQT